MTVHLCVYTQGIEEIGEQELREFEPDDLLGDPDPNVVMKLTKLKVHKIIPSDREVVRVMRGKYLNAFAFPAFHRSHALDKTLCLGVFVSIVR